MEAASPRPMNKDTINCCRLPAHKIKKNCCRLPFLPRNRGQRERRINYPASGGWLLLDAAQGPREGDPPIPLSSTGLPKPLSPPLLDGASRVATFFPETTSQMAVSVGGEDDPFSFPDHHHQKLPPDVA